MAADLAKMEGAHGLIAARMRSWGTSKGMAIEIATSSTRASPKCISIWSNSTDALAVRSPPPYVAKSTLTCDGATSSLGFAINDTQKCAHRAVEIASPLLVRLRRASQRPTRDLP